MSKEQLKEFVLELQSFLRKWEAEISVEHQLTYYGTYLSHTVTFRTPTNDIILNSNPTTNADSLDEFLANMNNPKYYFGK